MKINWKKNKSKSKIISLSFWIGILFGLFVALFISEYFLSFWQRTLKVKAGIIILLFPIICIGCGFIFISIKKKILSWNLNSKTPLPILIFFIFVISALFESQLSLPKGIIGNEWSLAVSNTIPNSGESASGAVFIKEIKMVGKIPYILYARDCNGVWENQDASFFSTKDESFSLECEFHLDSLSRVDIIFNTGPQYGVVDVLLKGGIFSEHIQKINLNSFNYGERRLQLGTNIKLLAILFRGINFIVIMGLCLMLSLAAFSSHEIIAENVNGQSELYNSIVNRILTALKLRPFFTKFRKLAALLEQVPLWVYPLILALLLFFTRYTYIYPDSLSYLNWGQSLERGLGYVDSSWQPVTYRGPVFSGLIALFYMIFGNSVRSALWMVRLFFTLNVLVVYIMGSRFFNRWVGFMASMFVVTSVLINDIFNSVLTDPVMSVFMLLAVLVLFESFKKKHDYLFILAGVLLGLAFLTKSTAGILLPLPVLVWLWCPSYRSRRMLRGVVCFYVGAALFILPWLIYTFIVFGSFNEINVGIYSLIDPLRSGGNAAVIEGVASHSMFAALFNQVSSLLGMLVTFYQRDVQSKFILAPLFILSLVYGFYRLVRYKSLQDGLLVFSFLLYGLLIPIQVRENFGPRQNIYHYLLFYLLLGNLLWAGVKNVGRQVYFRPIAYAAICLIFGLQIFAGSGAFTTLFLNPALSYGPTFNPVNFSFTGFLSPGLEVYRQWLQKNITTQDEILTDIHRVGITYFYLDARQPIHTIDFNYSRDIKLNSASPSQCYPLLYLWVYAGITDTETGRGFLAAVCENQLLAQIHEEHIKYIILTDRSNFLYPYLITHPAFSEIEESFGSIKIFRVNEDPQPIDSYPDIYYETHLGVNTAQYMNNLRQQNPEKYQELVDGYLRNWLQLSNEVIQQIEQDKYPAFDSFGIYPKAD